MAMTALATPALPPTGCRAVDLAGRVLPLRASHVAAEAAAGHARVVLEQVFENPYAEPLDITYTLPLPADGAVAGFAFTVGEHEVVGEVKPKAQARATFEAALVEGRTAALLDEARSSVFTQQLGNVPPGATLRCRITVDQPLAWEAGAWVWRFPTVVGPRYLGATPPADAAGVVVDVARDGVPDATLSVALRIGDAPSGPATSPSHAATVEGGDVVLSGALDRDVVVRWPVAQPTPGVQVQVARHGDEAFAAVTVVPPRQPPSVVARHLVVLLDTSGSMGGRPLDQAKEVVSALIGTLGPADHLELLAFASTVERFAEAPRAMDLASRREALAWLRARQARGGTEMTTGIREAVAGPSVDGAQKQVLLVTDGYIGFEAEIVGIALDERDRDTRIHTLGVGSAVNRSLTEPVARAGGGLEAILGVDDAVGPTAARLVAHTAQPVVVDLELVGEAVHTTSHRLPDLYAGAPVTLFAQVDPAGGPVTLRGRTAEGAWEHTLVLPAATEDGPASTRWARDQVADLELLCAAGRRQDVRERRIEALGVAHAISTRFTSWVATTAHRTVDPDAQSRAVTQPQALPHGVSAEGVGLRPAAPLAAAVGGMAAPEADAAAFGAARSLSAAPQAPRKRMARKERAAAPPPPAPLEILREEEEADELFVDVAAGSAPEPADAPAPEPEPSEAPATERGPLLLLLALILALLALAAWWMGRA